MKGDAVMLARHELMHELMVKHRIRSVSDYAEQIVAEALDGSRERSGTTGFDLTAPGLGKVEVKFRQLPHDGRLEERVALKVTKKDRFDYLAVVVFDPDFRVKGAVLVPYAEAWKFVSASAYNRISYGQACSCNGAINITAEVDAASQS